jgi:hypothetical protein
VLFGQVSYVQPPEGEPHDFAAKADFTDILAEDNPDWRIDLNDGVIGRWRGEVKLWWCRADERVGDALRLSLLHPSDPGVAPSREGGTEPIHHGGPNLLNCSAVAWSKDFTDFKNKDPVKNRLLGRVATRSSNLDVETA